MSPDECQRIIQRLDRAVEHADQRDAELGILTTILIEPGGFIVRMECRRGAVGYGYHRVCRSAGFREVFHSQSDVLVKCVDEAAAQVVADLEAYAGRKARGELTTLGTGDAT